MGIVDRVNHFLAENENVSRESLVQRVIGLEDELRAARLPFDFVREQTAAAILAALIVRGAPLETDNLAETSTMLTDALRAALAKGGGQ